MEPLDLNNYEAMLKIAGHLHSDICHGIRIGARMAMCGLKRIRILDPKGTNRKKLIVFGGIKCVHNNTIMALTSCTPASAA